MGMDNLLRDLTFAHRLMRRHPVTSLIAVISLALGIGANTTIFSLVNEIFVAPLPVEEPHRLADVYVWDDKVADPRALSYLNWKDLREESTAFAAISGYVWTAMNVSTGSEPVHTMGQLVSGNYFETLGVGARLGRTFSPEEDETPGTHPVVVLSHRFWTERLGGAPGALGQPIRINGSPFTVIGVAPPGFTGLDMGVVPALWTPMTMNKVLQPSADRNHFESRAALTVHTFGRLQPDFGIEEAAAEVATISGRLERDFPINQGRQLRVRPLTTAKIEWWDRADVSSATLLLAAMVGIVLLLACVNVANLLLVRASARRREIGIRLALGIDRSRLVRQLLTESVALSLLGGALGLFVAFATRKALLGLFAGIPLPWSAEAGLGLAFDFRVLGFTLVLSLVTGVLFGLAPAVMASRPRFVSSLKEGGDAPGGRRLGLRHVFVTAQVALSVVALVVAGLFLRSLAEARRLDPGFDMDHLVMVSLDPSLQGDSEEETRQLYRRLTDQAATLPGVTGAAIAQAGPMEWTWFLKMAPQGETDLDDAPYVQTNAVTSGFFEVMGIEIEHGRPISDVDRQEGAMVGVVNREMAQRFWPGQDAVGQRLHLVDLNLRIDIVGQARDMKYNSLGEDPQPYLYVPLSQHHRSKVTLVARTAGAPDAMVPTLVRAIRDIDPELPVTHAASAPRWLADGLWATRLVAVFSGLFGSLALSLAAIGLYAVTSHMVTRRFRELGIRIALGARRRSLVALVLRRSLGTVALGLAIGLLCSVFARQLVGSFLFVSPSDTGSIVGSLCLLAAVAFVATLEPALKATAVDPITALRQD